MNNFAAYLYDLDGTLLDSFPDLIHALKLSLDPLEIIDEKQIKNQVSYGGKAMIECAIKGRLNKKQIEEKLEQFLNQYYKQNCFYSKLFSGIKEILDFHSKNNQKWAIISNKQHLPTCQISKHLGLKANFVLGAGLVSKMKPHPEPLLYVCEKLKINPKKCLFIGDHQNDLLAAKNANMPCALATWGYIANLDLLLDLKPNFILNHPQDILKI